MKNREACKPITVESLQSNGNWSVRNAFVDENKLVKNGIWERQKLIDIATRKMHEWHNVSESNLTLRIGGLN